MDINHRYSDDEIAAIFEQAAEAQENAHAQAHTGEGLTLHELQQIGAESGISAEFIARAASNVLGETSAPKTSGTLGFPMTVEHSIALPRTLSDDEWDELVADLRKTFRASGKVDRSGSLREWRNGNLHVHVEPGKSGDQLSFRTTKGSASRSILGGSIFVAIGLMFLIMRLLTGDLTTNPDTFFVGMLALAGAGMIGLTRFTLPVWAKERSRQMEEIGKKSSGAHERPSLLKRIWCQLSKPQIDLDLLPDQDEELRAPESEKTRCVNPPRPSPTASSSSLCGS